MGLQNLFGERGTHLEMNEEFRSAIGAMESGNASLFITGRAGTGKSTLLEYFRTVTTKNVAVLAPTGVAALNVRGQTIHSFFHFKPDITPDTVRRTSRQNRSMYSALDALIIDEISMVRADLLDCVDRFMRINGRDADLPFGGVQLILIGDLYQLPPVVPSSEVEIFRTHYKSPYFFDAHSFRELRIRRIELRKHYRQKEQEFIGLLNAIRNNAISDAQIGQLNSRVDPTFEPAAGDHYVTLTPTNSLADGINEERLGRIGGPAYNFKAHVGGDFEKKAHPADERLSLKVGAQVMMLNNDGARRWVNGSMGEVTAIRDAADGNKSVEVRLIDGPVETVEVQPHTWELFRFSYNEQARKLISSRVGSFTQYPMMLAWAVTIHKSQGKTFDRVVIDLGAGTFAHGQLYVALSRCTTMGGIVLKKPVDRRHIMMDPRVTEFLAQRL
jgi:ATP-dependent exoDNAse (exonuclease V) alpha subunit